MATGMSVRISHFILLAALTAPVIDVGAQTIPRLELIRIDSSASRTPADIARPIAVGPDGSVLIVADQASDTRLSLLPLSASRLIRFGKEGAGPGEVQNPLPLWVDDNTASVLDIRNARIVHWSRAGEYVGSSILMQAVVPVGTPNGIFALRIVRAGRYSVVRIEAGTGGSAELRTVIDTTDRFLMNLGGVGTTEQPRFAPVIGYWSGGIALGDPNTFTIGLYDWSGGHVRAIRGDGPRQTPEGQRLERMVSENVALRSRMSGAGRPPAANDVRQEILRIEYPYFSTVSPIGTDHRGRMWVASQSGDSARVYVFSPDRQIGKLEIPCPHFVSRFYVKGEYMTLVCDAIKEDAGASLWLYRIRG